MKVIKHLKHETPQYKLRVFFKQMPLITRIILPLIAIASISLLIIDAQRTFAFYAFFDVRPISELLLFTLVGLTDFQKQQRRGSIFFIISYLLKISLLAGLNTIVELLLSLTGLPNDFFSSTSYPFLFCFMIAFRDMVLKSNGQRYFLIASFQIKYLFYPIFLAILLELFGLRIDLICALLISVLGAALKLDEMLLWVSKKIDSKILSNKAISCGMLATGCSQIQMSQIQRVTTNHSIVLDEN